MNSDISKRFVECHDRLKDEGGVRSSRQFALSLDYAPQSFSDIVNGKRDVTIDLIRKAVEKYAFNSHYIFTGNGSLFYKKISATNPIVSILVDESGEERILHVPVRAQAGYADQLYDPEFIEQLPSFTLPDQMFQKGTFRCFGVKGDSMEPLLHSGDMVVCSFLEKEYWVNSIKDNQVYVVVHDGGIVVKRIINNITATKNVMCLSVNSYYEPYELHLGEIKEIWKVEINMTKLQDAPTNVRESFQEQIDCLKTIIENQSAQIANFNKTMERLLRNKRVG
jgi:hypothetical protein